MDKNIESVQKLLSLVNEQINKLENDMTVKEIQIERWSELIFDFIEENKLEEKFYQYLQNCKEKHNDFYDIIDLDFIMLDYKPTKNGGIQ